MGWTEGTAGKWLELLQDTVPRLSTIAVIANPNNDGVALYRFDIGVPVNAGVITYAVNGKQYVALATGATTAFWRAARASSRVSVFSLPEQSSTQ